MIRTQIQLTEEQHRALKELADSRQVSVAKLIRESVATYLTTANKPSMEKIQQRAMSLAGKYHDIDGATDVSVNHDKYLAEIYADEVDTPHSGK
ncbi:MAG: ribbon-helix-helix domain-containing protein [Chloroflexi bacterium]|nr:ribbon-helix-helix domain-containing protein [Chloroflexota bacterium]